MSLEEFLGALGSFLKSDFAKENTAQIIILQIGIIGITIFVTVLYFNIIHIPVKLKRSDYIVPQYEEALMKIKNLESENARMKEEIKVYKRNRNMEKTLNSDGVKEGFQALATLSSCIEKFQSVFFKNLIYLSKSRLSLFLNV